jgi:hypothetical protein
MWRLRLLRAPRAARNQRDSFAFREHAKGFARARRASSAILLILIKRCSPGARERAAPAAVQSRGSERGAQIRPRAAGRNAARPNARAAETEEVMSLGVRYAVPNSTASQAIPDQVGDRLCAPRSRSCDDVQLVDQVPAVCPIIANTAAIWAATRCVVAHPPLPSCAVRCAVANLLARNTGKRSTTLTSIIENPARICRP